MQKSDGVRVLLVTNGLFPGGAETFVVDLAEALSALGAVVGLACVWAHPEDRVSADFVARLAAAEVGVYDLGHRDGRARVKLLWSYLRALRAFNPDVISAHCLYPELLVWWGARVWPHRARRVRTVQNIEYTDHGDPTRLWYKLARGFHKTLAGSDDMAQSHNEKCPNLPAAQVILDGRDLAHFAVWSGRRDEARRQLDLDAQTSVLCTVGRLVWRKNHELLLRSLALLRNRLADRAWLALICGRGELEAHLRGMGEELGLTDHVRFLGAVPDVAVPLAASDVFVMTPHYEGLGLAAVEAHATGLPVVATRVPGLRWVVDHGETGLLVASEPEAIADALSTLLTGRERAAEMGRRGQTVALARHDMGRCARTYLDVFSDLLNRA
ncbi:MAG: glycosyltransferase family 4 protein [Armatimonadetes bacterium]|nr:glycosyltransferase family 4 protein [Armatimonadota bacterium]